MFKFSNFSTLIASGASIGATVSIGYYVVKKSQKITTDNSVQTENISFVSYDLTSKKIDETIKNVAQQIENIIKISERGITIPNGTSINAFSNINENLLNQSVDESGEIATFEDLTDQSSTYEEEATEEDPVEKTNDDDEELSSGSVIQTDEVKQTEENTPSEEHQQSSIIDEQGTNTVDVTNSSDKKDQSDESVDNLIGVLNTKLKDDSDAKELINTITKNKSKIVQWLQEILKSS